MLHSWKQIYWVSVWHSLTRTLTAALPHRTSCWGRRREQLPKGKKMLVETEKVRVDTLWMQNHRLCAPSWSLCTSENMEHQSLEWGSWPTFCFTLYDTDVHVFHLPMFSLVSEGGQKEASSQRQSDALAQPSAPCPSVTLTCHQCKKDLVTSLVDLDRIMSPTCFYQG